ncbi:rRNA adenine N-6-methyltransferase family protein [Streptomyces sirii]|uniref:rRNA adenine N-6-methyltransferase family protein n=1 Tax=Streptomyces sirii TaxID=3127701 RepID=UPI003D363672
MQHLPTLGTATALPPADVFASDGFQVRADLGQHFLRSPESARRLLERANIPAGAQVLEVGAGLGTLSATIAASGYRIWAVEKDKRLRDQLCRQLGPFGDHARVTIDDVRRVDLDGHLNARSTLVSIMPFDADLSTSLITHVFASSRLARGLVVLTSRSAELLAADTSHGLRVEEVDGIARADFWPPAPAALRVVAIERRQPCRN